MTPLILFGLWLTCPIIIGWAMYRAPEGFEVEGVGFVYGKPVPPAALDEPDFDGDGNDLKAIYYAGRRLSDTDGFMAPVSFHHDAGVRQ